MSRPPRTRTPFALLAAISIASAVLSAFLINDVPPVVAALVGASLMLLTRAVNPKRLYFRVDWTLLALFTGLFVVVAGVEEAGLAERLLVVLEPLHPQSVWPQSGSVGVRPAAATRSAS